MTSLYDLKGLSKEDFRQAVAGYVQNGQISLKHPSASGFTSDVNEIYYIMQNETSDSWLRGATITTPTILQNFFDTKQAEADAESLARIAQQKAIQAKEQEILEWNKANPYQQKTTAQIDPIAFMTGIFEKQAAAGNEQAGQLATGSWSDYAIDSDTNLIINKESPLYNAETDPSVIKTLEGSQTQSSNTGLILLGIGALWLWGR